MGMKPRPSTVEVIEPLIEYLNVDLDLEAPFDLGELAHALGSVFVLHQTHESPFVCSLELADDDLNFDDTLTGWIGRIEALDPSACSAWQRCTKRVLSLGVQSGLGPSSIHYDVPSHLVARLAAIGASLELTIYGARYQAPI